MKFFAILVLFLFVFFSNPSIVFQDVQPVEQNQQQYKLKRYADFSSRHLRFRELEVVATAYSAEDKGIRSDRKTYSGFVVDKGIIAVDPEVIPLGSIVYIPGYGYMVAMDTGGAIKGNRIDIYFADRKEAIKFGRQKIKIRIIH